jgi:hypothetical protein
MHLVFNASGISPEYMTRPRISLDISLLSDSKPHASTQRERTKYSVTKSPLFCRPREHCVALWDEDEDWSRKSGEMHTFRDFFFLLRKKIEEGVWRPTII